MRQLYREYKFNLFTKDLLVYLLFEEDSAIVYSIVLIRICI